VGVWARTRALIRRELALPMPQQLGARHLLGGLTLFFFLLQVLTGILLMVYYQPTAESAHSSIQYVTSTARLGWLVRSLHHWGAQLLMLLLGLHFLRVFWDGAHRERELNWLIGLVLLLFLIAFGFTGMLLSWDQSAFWTTDAARREIARLPLLGPLTLDFLWGGLELGEGALLRFYVFHVGLLPWLTVFLIAVHLYLVLRQGLFVPAGAEARATRRWPQGGTYGELALDVFIVLLLVFGGTLTLAVLAAPGLGPPPDPLTPAPPAPPWYFLPIYGLFRLLPAGGGLLVLLVLAALLLAVPWLDRASYPGARRLLPRAIGLLLLLALLWLGVQAAAGQEPEPPSAGEGIVPEAQGDSCLVCHSEVKTDYLESRHAAVGVDCVACHGGDPTTLELDQAHDPERGYRGTLTRAEIPLLCASCHASPSLMKPYGLRTDQFIEYLTSQHGRRWSEGYAQVAICTDCHTAHLVLPSYDPRSSVNPQNVPETCARCHSDAALMAKYGLSAEAVEAFKRSIHGVELLERANLKAPSCATCHGSHGATPPGVEDVSKVCGTCHINEQKYFNASPHKPAMDQLGISECTGCHANHDVQRTMVGELFDTTCARCHASDSKAQATGEKLKALLVQANQALQSAEEALTEAQAHGYDVEAYRARLIEARSYFIEALPVQHGLDVGQVEELVRRTRSIAEDVRGRIHRQLSGWSVRLVGLALVWVYLALMLLVALLYRRERRLGR
jgi:cytochrome b6